SLARDVACVYPCVGHRSQDWLSQPRVTAKDQSRLPPIDRAQEAWVDETSVGPVQQQNDCLGAEQQQEEADYEGADLIRWYPPELREDGGYDKSNRWSGRDHDEPAAP